ncbi:uncharacterized protein LOC119686466 [Teleopsis dalmanni]|uniref:uncharacterized protein LOC119686466 n=1 Tax=Teleopsis dalmanni TaxID=139649 RepID=UPI0018CCD7D8|nr:uncharacterized protein LOC119686466 [Teleopsis dalmanni]
MSHSQKQMKKVEKQSFRREERRHTTRNGLIQNNTPLMSGVQDTCQIRFSMMATTNSNNKKKITTKTVKCTETTETTKPTTSTTSTTPTTLTTTVTATEITTKLTTRKAARPPPKKMTRTAIMSELIKLKSQQKFLECSQVKLNTENFKDADDFESKETSTSKYSLQAARNLIHEIDQLKRKLDTEVSNYRRSAHHEVQDITQLVHAFKENVLQPERFMETSMNAIRQRIIDINVAFGRLLNKNSNELKSLQSECERLQTDKKILVDYPIEQE